MSPIVDSFNFMRVSCQNTRIFVPSLEAGIDFFRIIDREVVNNLSKPSLTKGRIFQTPTRFAANQSLNQVS
jgi:hypothetical protein